MNNFRKSFEAFLLILTGFFFYAPYASAYIVNVDSGGAINDALPGPTLGTSIATTNIFTFTVSGAPSTISDLDLRFSAYHPYVKDLAVNLRSPFGTEIDLFIAVDGGGDNFQDTYFDEEGGILRIGSQNFGLDVPPYPGPEYGGIRMKPEDPLDSLNRFYGQNPNGIWTLSVVDMEFEDSGFLLKAGATNAPWGIAIGTQLIFDPVPEPSLMALMAAGGLVSLFGVRRKFFR